MLPFQMPSWDALQQHAKNPGIWGNMEDGTSVSSDPAKRRMHLKSGFRTVFNRLARSVMTVTGLEILSFVKGCIPQIETQPESLFQCTNLPLGDSVKVIEFVG